jgi:hypothetical protein
MIRIISSGNFPGRSPTTRGLTRLDPKYMDRLKMSFPAGVGVDELICLKIKDALRDKEKKRVEVGLPHFDKKVFIMGQEAAVFALLNEEARETISVMVGIGIELKPKYVTVKPEGSRYGRMPGNRVKRCSEFLFVGLDQSADVLQVNRVVEAMHQASTHLFSKSSVEKKLLENIHSEPEAFMRAQNLAMLEFHYPDSTQTSEAFRLLLKEEFSQKLSKKQQTKLIGILEGSNPKHATGALDVELAAVIVLRKHSDMTGSLRVVNSWVDNIDDTSHEFLKRVAYPAREALKQRSGPIEHGRVSIVC